MANKELIEEVGKYIDKYYEPGSDDIKMDSNIKSESSNDELEHLQKTKPILRDDLLTC